MDATIVERIKNDPAFIELEAKRNRFGWTLTIVMLVIYYGFIALIAFAPKVLAINVGGAITLGFPLGLLVILSAIALTGTYVLRANSEFDALTRRIVENVR